MHVPHRGIAFINGEEKGYGCEIQNLVVDLRRKYQIQFDSQKKTEHVALPVAAW